MSDSGTDEIERASLIVAAVALVVAFVALTAPVAQVIQQYWATAIGYSNCTDRVLGNWAVYTRRKFHRHQLRFEVIFTSPQISVCVCGSPSSHDRESEYAIWPGLKHGGLSCAPPIIDNHHYLASWLSLLATVRDMEWSRASPGGAAQFMSGNVHIVLRPRVQTLDLMPDGVKKPYATTTLSSIVSIAAMLGMHWKQFDRATDRYVAEGNGLLLAGHSIPNLGIMFSFRRHGDPDFVRKRAIPALETIEYCFGLVPTIFRPRNAGTPQNLAETPRDLGTLRLGNQGDIFRTMKLLNFAQSQIEKLDFNQEFPVLFELIGMLGRVVQIPNTPWRMLPNPLPFRWDVTTISGPTLLSAFVREIGSRVRDKFDELVSDLVRRAAGLAVCLLTPCSKAAPPEANPDLMKKLGEAVYWCDEWLNPGDPISVSEILMVIREHVLSDRSHLTEYSESQADVLIRHYLNHVHPAVERNLAPLWAMEQAVGNVSASRTPRAIWLVLVFRMVCWLTLHTFDPLDAQIDSKGLRMADLMGTSLPVYIS